MIPLKNYLLGIDLGTSACKAALFDLDGGVAGQASRTYPVYYPQPGWAEQNPEEWWQAVCLALKQLLAESRVSPQEIGGIGVDGQSWSAIPLDREGNVLCNTPIWMDTRAEEICRELSRTIGEEEIFSLCGNPLQPAYTLPKILWYKRYRPKLYGKIDVILQSNSFIGYKLTGKRTQDISQGYGLHCFDMQRGCWDEQMCARMGVDPAMLPPIFPSHGIIGTVTEKAAQETGLLPGIPVAAGGLDAACGTLGAGVIRQGQTQEQGGQAGGMSICIDRYHADPRLILGYHVIPGRWLLQGGTVGGGGVVRWLEQELGEADRQRAAERQSSSLYELDQAAAAVPPGSEGVIFLPYMAGERSPIWDPKAKGVFYGLDFSKTRGHLLRAGMEGVAFSLLHNLETARSIGVEVEELRAMGGAANSRLWTQIKADVTGKKFCVPASDTATTLGAAILAGVGVGLYTGFEEAVERTVRIQRVHEPREENREVYRQQFSRYLELYDRLKEMMQASPQ